MTKKTAAKAAPKSRYFVQVDKRLVDAGTELPAVSPIALSGNEAKAADADPSFYEVTKRQYDAAVNRIQEGSVFFVDRVKDEVKERTRGAGDIIWAVLLLGAGIFIGGILF